MNEKEIIKYIIGIDEVGRGPLAGPVAVCAFLMKKGSFVNGQFSTGQTSEKLPKLKDSKKLSKKQREVWFEYLKVARIEGFCDYAVSFVSSENIDKFGIAKCIQKALNESLSKIASSEFLFSRTSDEGGQGTRLSLEEIQTSIFVYLDGGLKAPIEYVNQETIIRGDELNPVISMASIVAKVTRDAVMTKYSKDYPEYGFEKHSGYGTKTHYEAIKTHGQTPIHRKTFIH